MDLWQKLELSIESLYRALFFLTPLIAGVAVYYCRRAVHLAERNNHALESMWILLKAIRYRQDNAGPPPMEEPDDIPGFKTPKPPEPS